MLSNEDKCVSIWVNLLGGEEFWTCKAQHVVCGSGNSDICKDSEEIIELKERNPEEETMKERSMRKLLFWALTLSMLLSVLPAAAFAEEVPLVGAIADSEVAKPEEKADDEKVKGEAVLSEAEAELFATTVNVSSVSELQSAHPYSSSMDKTWIYTHPTSAAGLSVTFSSDTETESRYDYIYIYDGAGTQVGKYDGTTLAGKTIEVSGNVVTIRLTSDSSVQKNGFTVTNISATGDVEPEENTAEFAGGNGTENAPYLIESKAHLNNVRNYRSAHFKMTADVTFIEADFAEGGTYYNNGTGWKPIGTSSSPFKGTFDGNGHTITGLKQNIYVEGDINGGLFGYADGARIKNLGVIGGDIKADTHRFFTAAAGGIVGRAYNCIIGNCYNTGLVKAQNYVGGIVGYASNSIIR